MAHTGDLRTRLYEEMASRTSPNGEQSARWRHGEFVYYTKTVEGKEYEQFWRASHEKSSDALLLDLNDLASGAAYARLGVRQPSPDGKLLAYSIDLTGDEVYELRVRDLASGADLDDRVRHTYYTCAWSADSRFLFYVVHDTIYRPFQVWRHKIGTD